MKRKTLYLDAPCFDLLEDYDGRGSGPGKNELARRALHLGNHIESAGGADALERAVQLAKDGDADALADFFSDLLADDEDPAPGPSPCSTCGQVPCVCDEGNGSDAGDDGADGGGRSLAPTPGPSATPADGSTDVGMGQDGDPHDDGNERGDTREARSDSDRHGGAVSEFFRRQFGGE
jgi:hypothetical protein